MKKFIKDIKNINNNNTNINETIKGLKLLIDMYKKNGDNEKVKMFENELKELKLNNIEDINLLNEYLKEIQKVDKFSSLPVKIDNETKNNFKEISKEIGMKQGELFGILIKYFVENYYKDK